MSVYTVSFGVRYEIPSIQQQAEVAVMHCVQDINNEGTGAPNHADRARWASWANGNSSVAVMPFMWPVAMNPAVQSAVAADPSGGTVADGDVQFIVNGALDTVITEWVSANPPPV
jgi:hypothetical protein